MAVSPSLLAQLLPLIPAAEQHAPPLPPPSELFPSPPPSWRGRQLRSRDAWELAPGQRNIVLFGPPGVGKGAQSEQLVRLYGVCHVSTGDLLRAEIARGTPLGKQVEDTMAQGKLMPDRLMIRMVRRRLSRDKRCQEKGWLLDGFPRTGSQALAMLSAGLVPHHVVLLNASSTTLLSRALRRYPGCPHPRGG